MSIDRTGTAGSAGLQREPFPWKALVVLVADLSLWAVMFALASVNIGIEPLKLAAIACGVHLAVGLTVGLYREQYQPTSFEEIGALTLSAAAGGAAALAVHVTTADQLFMRSVALAGVTTLLAMFAVRYLRRFRALAVHRRLSRRESMPVLVVGAGEGGLRAIRAMHNDASRPYLPLAVIDDNPAQRNRRIEGVRVEGTMDDLAELARRHHARGVLVAIPSASNATLARLAERIRAVGMEPLVTPPVQRLVGAGMTAEITRINDESLMRRQMIEVDVDAVRAHLTGRCVLVTGAGGSIGSELSAQILEAAPSRLICVDHDDTALHNLRNLLQADEAVDYSLADVRDADRLEQLFAIHRPDLVFHAAALKHLPALETNPGEGWKTNVVGTANVLAACEAFGVEQMINISTDKAADPVSVLGYTKRIAERLTASSAAATGRRFVSVRFGNVIGSRGAVLDTFERQIAHGGPVTITHPDVTRFFMAIREAVRLTLQAAVIGRGGEVLVLDMGEPVRIADIARQMISQSGQSVEVRVVGLRQGEKLHEVLIGDGEQAHRPFHPMIDHVDVPPASLQQIDEVIRRHELDQWAPTTMRVLCTEGMRAQPDQLASTADIDASLPVDPQRE